MNLRECLQEEVLKTKEKMKREEMLVFIKRRRECNARAQKIVEQLLDTTTEDKFLDAVKYINQAHLDDIFEERFIVRVCGYPLCDTKLVNIPKQRYKISATANKVYDISERKKFCSSQCFSAAKFIREQLPSSPLWVLENQDHRKYKLWNPNKSLFLNGDEIKFTPDDLKKSDVGKKHQNVVVRTEPDKKQKEDINMDDTKNIKKNSSQISDKTLPLNNDSLSNLSDAVRDINPKDKEMPAFEKDTTAILPKHEIDKCATNVITKKYISPNKMTQNNEKVPLKEKYKDEQVDQRSIMEMVQHTLQKWITMNSLIYLLGEEKVKAYCLEIGYSIDSQTNSQFTPKQVEQYAKICKKLDMMEIKDQQVEKCDNLRPLPNYESLKLENHKLMVKVCNYFKGNTHIPTAELNNEPIEEPENKDSKDEPFLPLMDHHDQITMRRNIVFSYLEPAVSKFLFECKVNQPISTELRLLINTFELDAKTITFKPVLQKLIGIFVTKLLTLCDKSLDNKLDSIFSSAVFSNLLNTYTLTIEEFNTVITNVTSLENVIGTRK